MVNLAKSFGDLGRHDDALILEERALEFFRRVLPEDHLNTGESCACLSISAHMHLLSRALVE